MTSASGTADARSAVTVIGLGETGFALAGAFLAAGHPTTVWNRTSEKGDALVAKGARRAVTARDAVAASPLVVVSVKGNAVARDILESAGDALAGRAVVNLTDGTSAEARAVAEWATGRGVEYLHGQIMTIAPGIGHPETVVFYGGDGAVYDRYQPTLRLFGGRGSLIAADAGVPTLYGMAVHGTMWGTLNGFLHACALLSNEGIEVKRFLDQAGPFPGYTLALVADAVDKGHADDSYSRLVEHFKKR